MDQKETFLQFKLQCFGLKFNKSALKYFLWPNRNATIVNKLNQILADGACVEFDNKSLKEIRVKLYYPHPTTSQNIIYTTIRFMYIGIRYTSRYYISIVLFLYVYLHKTHTQTKVQYALVQKNFFNLCLLKLLKNKH